MKIWLLLHFEKISIKNDKLNINEINIDTLTLLDKFSEKFRQNLKVSNKHTFTSQVYSETTGNNPKSNLDFDNLLLNNVNFAINQEELSILEADVNEMRNKLGSNIGTLIKLLNICLSIDLNLSKH